MLRLVVRAASAVTTPRLARRVAHLQRGVELLLLGDRRAPWEEVRPLIEQVPEPGIIRLDPILYLPGMYWSFAKQYWVDREFDQLPGLVESLIGALERFVPRAAARARAAVDMERHPSFIERLQGEGAYEIGSHEYAKAQVARGILAWCQANQWEAATALVGARDEPTIPDRRVGRLELGRTEAELLGMPEAELAAVEREAARALRRLQKRRAEPGEPVKREELVR